MARREELGHPLGTIMSSVEEDASPTAAASSPAVAGAAPTSAELFVLEIGSEELPPDDVLSGMDQLR